MGISTRQYSEQDRLERHPATTTATIHHVWLTSPYLDASYRHFSATFEISLKSFCNCIFVPGDAKMRRKGEESSEFKRVSKRNNKMSSSSRNSINGGEDDEDDDATIDHSSEERDVRTRTGRSSKTSI
jgi:hypothetical protein